VEARHQLPPAHGALHKFSSPAQLEPFWSQTPLTFGDGMTSHPAILETDGVFTEESLPSPMSGEPVGGIIALDGSDWSNELRSKPGTESELSLKGTNGRPCRRCFQMAYGAGMRPWPMMGSRISASTPFEKENGLSLSTALNTGTDG
jgi:hypothetical protein